MTVADPRVELASELLGALVARDVPLAPLTTYRVGGHASLLASARSVADLVRVADAARRSGLPVLVVGRGSNLLVADGGFVGIVVTITELDSDVRVTADGLVEAGGGAFLPVVARRTVAAGLTGFEWAVGVPGSVGGAVRMNAGGHGSDMAASLVDVDVVDLHDPEPAVRRLPVDRLGLRFRGSALRDHQVVVAARLRLAPGDRSASEAQLAEVVRWRREHQPGGQNCGSVFVNPIPGELAAAELIDRLGLRGMRIGTARVSEKHANFVQADEGGRADDVLAVIREVRERVEAATGVRLRTEVRLVGFGDQEAG
ncbi:MAG: UDP-N-acetylmuramate dehydrogenase [Ilumatobacteraceae bacterium]|jgi:UDP-N-acetylmuramate dehydrogenase|nr:UDP-N-acetylmuramate dehydrogenase [Ilumatobacteraceae bacterium]